MLVLGGAVGAVQGWFIAFEGIPAFIVTLAGLSVLRGMALLLTQGYSMPISPESWFVGARAAAGSSACRCRRSSRWSRSPPASSRSPRRAIGRYVTAIGANAEAARRAGIDIRRVTLSVYVLTGIAAAAAGIIIAARLGCGSSNAAVGFELEVIAAVVLGGTTLFGGRGTILGTVLGALTIAVIGNGLILAHISPFFTQIVTGVIILAAIWLNTRLFAAARRVRLR